MIQRSELEETYLRHQLFELRRDYPGSLETDYQPIATDDFYDDYRLMVHCPELTRVYELLYYRDRKTLSKEILSIIGNRWLASLWADCGRSDGKQISFKLAKGLIRYRYVATRMKKMGYGETEEELLPMDSRVLRLSSEASQRFAREIYPMTHVSMRKGLLTGTR